MPLYEFKCKGCGATAVSQRREVSDHFCSCGGEYKRIFSFSIARPMQEHFNAAVGKPISSHRQFRDELARKSDQESERLNMTVNLQPVDLADKESLGVTDEGLQETHDHAVRTGQREPTPRLIL